MSEGRRRRSSLKQRDRGGAGIKQLPLKRIVSPFDPVRILNDDQVEDIHNASMRILEELGIELMSAEARALFRKAGADVDEASGVVKLDWALVADLIRTAPSEITVTPRNPERSIILGGRNISFSLVAGPPNVHDRERGRRAGNYQDYCDLVRLAQHFNIIHLLGNQVVAPIDLPANSRHMDTYYANLSLTDKTFHVSAIGAGRARDGINMLAIARGKSLDEIQEEPGILTVISVNSPRRFDDSMADGLIEMARHGQVVVLTPFTLMGAMTPVTLAAGLAQQNAEALFGIALTQLVKPGAPAVYGAFTSNVDMKSGAPAFGTPENTKANIASGQLARRYNLPYRTTNGNAANCVDAQATYETQMSLWGAILGHCNLVYHAAGWLEGGLTASFEKIMLDVEMLQHMAETLTPIDTSEAELAFDAMSEVPTGGHFFGTAHTMERYESAFYAPMLSDWTNYEAWELAGAKTTTERATELWKQALEEYQQPQMDPAVDEALKDYMARRREEIGAGEP